MKVFIVLIGYILAAVAQNGNNLSDLNDIVICATFNNVNRTFDNIWQVYNEFKNSGQLWFPVATGACPVNNIDCTILNPVCAVSSNNFFKTFPNQCVLEAEQKATGTVWKIVFHGICSENDGDGFVDSTPAPLPVTPAPAYPVPSSNPVPSPISSQYNSATVPVSSYSAPTSVPVALPSPAYPAISSNPSQYNSASAPALSYSVVASDVKTPPATGDYNPAVPGQYDTVPAPSSAGNKDSPIYNSYHSAPIASSSLYASSVSNPVPLPISDNYNSVSAPAPSYTSDKLKPVSSPGYSSDITSSSASGSYASVDTSQPSPAYSGASYAETAPTAPTASDCNQTPSAAAAASSSSYPATANNNLSPAPSYATILSDPVSPQLSSASAPSPSLNTNLDSIFFNGIPLTNLLKIFSPSDAPAPSAYSPPAQQPVPSPVYSAPSAEPLPLPLQPYSAAASDQSAAYINSDSLQSYVPDSPVKSAPDYTSLAVSISEAVSQYSNPSDSNSASPIYLQQSKSGQAPYGNTSPLILPSPLTPAVKNEQYPTAEVSYGKTDSAPSPSPLPAPLTPSIANVQYPVADDNLATNNYAQQPEPEQIPNIIFNPVPIATVQQTEQTYQQSPNIYSETSGRSYGVDTPSPSQSYQPPSDTPASSIAVDAACSNAEIYTSPVHNYENLPSNSNDVSATSDNFANFYDDNNVTTDLADQNKYAQEENSTPAPLTADNSNQNADTEGQTIYNGVVYQGPYYYEPKYKHINYGNFNFLPAQNQNTASAAVAAAQVPTVVPAFSMNPFEQLLKQLQFIATRNVISG